MVSGEIVCVTRPGGRIVMGNWIPNDPYLGRADPENQQVHTQRCRKVVTKA